MLVCKVELWTLAGLGLETPAIFIRAEVKRVSSTYDLHKPSVQLLVASASKCLQPVPRHAACYYVLILHNCTAGKWK